MSEEASNNDMHDQQLHRLTRELETNEQTLGLTSANLCPFIFNLTNFCLKNKHFQQATEYANRLLAIAQQWSLADFINTATKLIEDIENAKRSSLCSKCEAPAPKYKCSRCKRVVYCSAECQKDHWATHKPACKSFESVMNAEKKMCGLCGFTGDRNVRIIKTKCCKRWICEDQDNYQIMSYRLNSCYRNHQRYTQCGRHVDGSCGGRPGGRWQDCRECQAARDDQRNSSDPEDRTWGVFCEKHFLMENATEATMAKNRQLKTDENAKAKLTTINFNPRR